MKLTRITICAILSISPLYAEQPTIDSLEQRIKILERQMTELTIELQKSKMDVVKTEISVTTKPQEIVLDLTKQGRISIEGSELDEDKLSQKLKLTAIDSPNQPVIFRTSDNTKHQDVLRALELCKEAKIWNVEFAKNGNK